MPNQLNTRSVLNLNCYYVQKLKGIVEQEDKIKAQRDVFKMTTDIWCGFDSSKWMFSPASFNMLKEIIEAYDVWYSRCQKPDELIKMQNSFRVRQETLIDSLKAAGEPEWKWRGVPKGVDLRGIVWRHFLKIVKRPEGVSLTELSLKIGKACAISHRCVAADEECFLVGNFLVNLFMQNGQKMFAFMLEKNANSQVSYVVPTNHTLNWFLENNYLDLVELPCLLPWEQMPDDLKTSFESVLEDKNGKNSYLHLSEAKTPSVDLVLRKLSDVGLKINRKFFDWLMGNKDMLLKYEVIDEKESDIESRKANASFFVQQSILGVADVFYNVDDFYFPLFYDWRTRVYVRTTYLNYQGSKLALALLMFSKGKKITACGLRYLLLYGCGLYGVKGDHDALIKWVHEHTDKIVLVDKVFISKANEPFLFAAFCLEYRDYLENPDEFVSHLPVLIDCTCSGLQHLAAITQDYLLAKKVNLTESKERGDIYNSMALLLENDLCRDPVYCGLHVTRDFVKRPIMTISYSATLEGLTEQLLTFFTYVPDEKKFFKNDQPLFKLTKVQVKELAKKLLKLFYSEHPTLKLLLDYLQNIAKCMSALDLPIVWTTPAGVQITQKYNKRELKVIRNTSYKWLKRVSLPIGTNTIDKRKQCLGVMPNMVHSLDASNIYKLVENLEDNIAIFTIHDCFAGLASDMNQIEDGVKKAFVSIYYNENWISKLHKNNLSLVEAHYEVDPDGCVLTAETCTAKRKKIFFPKMPVLGDFDVKEVLKASFMLN